MEVVLVATSIVKHKLKIEFMNILPCYKRRQIVGGRTRGYSPLSWAIRATRFLDPKGLPFYARSIRKDSKNCYFSIEIYCQVKAIATKWKYWKGLQYFGSTTKEKLPQGDERQSIP